MYRNLSDEYMSSMYAVYSYIDRELAQNIYIAFSVLTIKLKSIKLKEYIHKYSQPRETFWTSRANCFLNLCYSVTQTSVFNDIYL